MEEHKEITLRTILYTKDGRRIGNGLVSGIKSLGDNLSFVVTTDYGKITTLNESEVRGLFYIGEIASPDHKNYGSK